MCDPVRTLLIKKKKGDEYRGLFSRPFDDSYAFSAPTGIRLTAGHSECSSFLRLLAAHLSWCVCMPMKRQQRGHRGPPAYDGYPFSEIPINHEPIPSTGLTFDSTKLRLRANDKIHALERILIASW
jgi:hypothetical protein